MITRKEQILYYFGSYSWSYYKNLVAIFLSLSIFNYFFNFVNMNEWINLSIILSTIIILTFYHYFRMKTVIGILFTIFVDFFKFTILAVILYYLTNWIIGVNILLSALCLIIIPLINTYTQANEILVNEYEGSLENSQNPVYKFRYYIDVICLFMSQVTSSMVVLYFFNLLHEVLWDIPNYSSFGFIFLIILSILLLIFSAYSIIAISPNVKFRDEKF